MKKTIISLSALALTSSVSFGALVRLDNTGAPGLGDNLDGVAVGDAPMTVSVPEILGLTITIHSLGPDGLLNATGTSLGINGASDTDTDAFESAFGQFATFSFNQAVSITQLDFTSFDNTGEVFNFGGVVINNGDLSNGTTDVYDFVVPFEITANTQFTIQATSGTIGIEAMTLTAVPESSSIALLGLGGLATLLRRRR